MPVGKVKADDPGLTPTEQSRKQQMMRQFLQLDGPKGASEEYKANYDVVFGPFMEVVKDKIYKCRTCKKEFAKEQLTRHLHDNDKTDL